MAVRNRMPPWHETIRLANGREVLVRPIRPEDAVPLRAGFALLQPEEIRHRFLYPMKELSIEQAQRLTCPNVRREFALVVAEPLPPGEALIGGVARISVDADGAGDAGEFAILVSHYINGMGLGRHLMRRLVRWAKGRKLERVYGDVLESNLPMQALAASLDFRREQGASPGLVRVVLDVPKAKPRLRNAAPLPLA
ncbi:MAG: GNAT family N-acetyltransferase [Pseudomonadota bacterium]|nr:GNAT family N-acetyltransferase [Pseudomonadota bacterium]MDQ3159944.1 GNAT family N-acetyltransferase [Pseudomonadota bacterium]